MIACCKCIYEHSYLEMDGAVCEFLYCCKLQQQVQGQGLHVGEPQD